MRLTVGVTPGARRPGVTAIGSVDDDGPALAVRVAARAVDGAATEAALVAVAEALGLRKRQVTLVRGATSRTKVFDVDIDGPTLQTAIAALI